MHALTPGTVEPTAPPHAARLARALAVLLLLVPLPGCGGGAPRPPAEGPAVADFALLDQHGRQHQLSEYGDRDAVVLFVHGVGCSIVRQTLPALTEVRRRFAHRDVAFLMLNANPQDDRAAVRAEAEEYGQDLPVLLDRAQVVAPALGIDRTAEALILDPHSRRLVWRGAVDDRLRYETQVAEPTRHQLVDALEAWLDGRPVPPADAPLRGCAISFPRRVGPPPGYADEIAPLLRARCGDCHAPGGIAPWAMTDHETVAGWSAMIREVVATRRMPPFAADPAFGALAPDGSLRADEAAALAAWIDAGSPRGQGPDPLVERPVTRPPDWPLGEPDVLLEIPEQSLPATGEIPYIEIDLELPFEEDTWIRGVHIVPGNPRVLHHVLVFMNPPGAAPGEADLERRWVSSVFGMYAPGNGAHRMPAGSGYFLPAGATLTLQLHYTPTGRPETDASVVGLYLAGTPPERHFRVHGLIDTKFVIPPGARDHLVIGSHHFVEDVVVHAFLPHMHYRGRSLRYDAHLPDGRIETLLSVPRFRFNWQFSYRLAEPRVLPAGTTLVASARYDNSRWNPDNPDPEARVRFGRLSTDEMLLAYVMYTHVAPDDAPGGSH